MGYIKDMAKATSNAKQWQSAMKAWMKAKRGASHDDCINKFGAESSVKAIAYTKKTSMGKLNTIDPAKGGRTYKQRVLYALAARAGIKKGAGGARVMTPHVEKMFSERKSSLGAIKAGFIKPAKQLGARLTKSPFAGGSASRSRGFKSRSFRMRASALNEVNASGEDDIGRKPMERAMNFVVQREHTWAIKRLQKANNTFSAKRF